MLLMLYLIANNDMWSNILIQTKKYDTKSKLICYLRAMMSFDLDCNDLTQSGKGGTDTRQVK